MNAPENSSQASGAALLFSGGVDSTVLLHYLVKRVKVPSLVLLTLVYGQRHQREVEAARKQATAFGDQIREHLVLDFSLFEKITGTSSALMQNGESVPELANIPVQQRDQPPTYVPNRNMIFLSIGAALAESRDSGTVYYGAQKQDEYGYWDCTPEFVSQLNAVLNLNRRHSLKIEAPFMELSKSEIVKLGSSLQVDFSDTWSCYRGEEKPCKVCPTCVERRIAFHEAECEDPLIAPVRKGVEA